jgi:hypothetical protein
MLGMKDFSSMLPLDPICRASPLNHGYETSWRRERFFFDGRLSWLNDMLDRGGLVALLHHVCRQVRRWWRCIVSHATCDRLLGPHLVLKRLTKPKKLPALDKEMRGLSPPILVDVGVPGTSSFEHLFRRKWWCITTLTPFRFWPRVVAGAYTAASVVVVPLPWSVMVVIAVIVYVACYYHICRIHILVAVSALSSMSWSGIDPSGRRRGLLIDDGF